MKQVMVRYRVKPSEVARNEELIRAVYAELEATEPPGLHYATFKLDDGVSFVHLAFGDGQSSLSELDAFRHFQEGINDRCDQPPVVTAISEIGSFRVFGSLYRHSS